MFIYYCIKKHDVYICLQIIWTFFFSFRKQSLGLFLAAIPFTLVAQLRWWMVPTVTLAGFTLYGIDAIGAEIGKRKG